MADNFLEKMQPLIYVMGLTVFLGMVDIFRHLTPEGQYFLGIIVMWLALKMHQFQTKDKRKK